MISSSHCPLLFLVEADLRIQDYLAWSRRSTQRPCSAHGRADRWRAPESCREGKQYLPTCGHIQAVKKQFMWTTQCTTPDQNTLFSFSHFSSSCLRPSARTGHTSSRDFSTQGARPMPVLEAHPLQSAIDTGHKVVVRCLLTGCRLEAPGYNTCLQEAHGYEARAYHRQNP